MSPLALYLLNDVELSCRLDFLEVASHLSPSTQESRTGKMLQLGNCSNVGIGSVGYYLREVGRDLQDSIVWELLVMRLVPGLHK